VLWKNWAEPAGEPPLQLPALPQETNTCSDKFRSIPGLWLPMRTFDSRAAVAAKAQQLPQPPWLRTGVTKFPPLLRQSKLAGAPTMGAASMLRRGSFPVRTGGVNPSRLWRSSGESRVMEVSPACHFAPFFSIAMWISLRTWPKASDWRRKKEKTASTIRKYLCLVIFNPFLSFGFFVALRIKGILLPLPRFSYVANFWLSLQKNCCRIFFPRPFYIHVNFISLLQHFASTDSSVLIFMLFFEYLMISKTKIVSAVLRQN
jgi:hypothetical protein